MYISGHESILNEILDTPQFQQLPITYNKQTLFKGLIYPDLPCGKYDLDTSSNPPKIVMTHKKLCNLANLYKTLDKYFDHKEIFQSHRGIYSFLHSMSHDPTLKVKDIVVTILENIASYAFLSLHENDIFWIGIILHMIMDSYSPAHTIRFVHKKVYHPQRQISNFSLPFFQLIDGVRDASNIHFKQKIKDALMSMIRKTMTNKQNIKTCHEDLKTHLVLYFSRKHEDHSQEIEFVKQKSHELFKAYKMYMFDAQRRQFIYSQFKLQYPLIKPKEPFDITNFQYYNNQSDIYHKRKDFLNKVRKYPEMYQRMKDECATVLKMYFDYANKIHITHKHEITKLIKGFVKEIYTYLASHTFRISQDDLKSTTGVQYVSNF